MRRHSRGILRVALVYGVLLGSLGLAVWRQSRALEILRALDDVRREQAVVEAERAELMRLAEGLESRGRVVTAARERLGMHVPRATEFVFLRLEPPALAAGERRDGAVPERVSRRDEGEGERRSGASG